jgi:hypothetical protein
MTKGNFYYIHIIPNENISNDDIQKVMDLFFDWFRLGYQNWILYTAANSKGVFESLENLIKPKGNLLVMKIDITDYIGFMPTNFWEWFNKLVGYSS